MSEGDQIRVLVVDDDPMVRSHVLKFIAGQPDIEIVAAVAGAAEAVEVVSTQSVDVVLLDLVMPVTDGVFATGLIKARAPQAQVVILTTLDDGERARSALDRGAIGFITKDISPEALVHVVRAAHAGLHVMTPPPFGRLVNPLSSGPLPGAPELSRREREALDLLCLGASNNEIGEQLGISASTVKSLVSSLIHKLEATSRLHVVARAHELRLDRRAER